MCLNQIDGRKQTKQYGERGYGWKVFHVGTDGIMHGIMGVYFHFQGEPYQIGKRYKSRPDKKGECRNMGYRPGFHIFMTKMAADRYLEMIKPYLCGNLKVYRVQWEGLIASGKQNVSVCTGDGWSQDCAVVVAKYMTILPPEEGEQCQT